jgi:hypothetical protein
MYDGASGDALGATQRDASVKVMLSHVCLGQEGVGLHGGMSACSRGCGVHGAPRAGLLEPLACHAGGPWHLRLVVVVGS